MEFREKNSEIPAIFQVDPFGSELIVNYRVSGNYIVIERVASQYTLRYGKNVTCVFNEFDPFEVITNPLPN